MKNTDLTNTYRELDRELAILHDQLESHRSFENTFFSRLPGKDQVGPQKNGMFKNTG